jgi:hypothetical protein
MLFNIRNISPLWNRATALSSQSFTLLERIKKKKIIIIIISRKTYFILVGHIQTTLNFTGTTSKFRSVTQHVIANMWKLIFTNLKNLHYIGPVTPLHEKFAGCHVGITDGRNLKKNKNMELAWSGIVLIRTFSWNPSPESNLFLRVDRKMDAHMDKTTQECISTWSQKNSLENNPKGDAGLGRVGIVTHFLWISSSWPT